MVEDWNRINEIYRKLNNIRGEIILYLLDSELGKEFNSILGDAILRMEQTVKEYKEKH